MNWLLSLLIGLLTAIVGCGCGLFIATKCVRWYRISSFEGGSGYYVMFMGLFGIIVGLILGTIAARFAVSGPSMSFPRGLGYAMGSMLTLALIVFALCRLAADIVPTIDGKEIELEIEVKGPANLKMPIAIGEYGAHAYIDLLGKKSQPQGDLRVDKATQFDGRWIFTATVPLRTSSGGKYLRAYFNKEHDAFFRLPLRAHPDERDFAWSEWIEAAWNIGNGRPDAESAFFLRYKVQVIGPKPSTEPTHEELEAKRVADEETAFIALSPDSALHKLLRYTEHGTPKERMDVAITHITGRPDCVAELAHVINSDDTPLATNVLRMLEHMPHPPAALNEPVAEYGRTIATIIREMNETPVEQDPDGQVAAEISVRFSAWRVAVDALRKNAGGDFIPELQEILTLARVRTDSHCMRMDVVRVASYYLHEWAGVPPLPADPKPQG